MDLLKLGDVVITLALGVPQAVRIILGLVGLLGGVCWLAMGKFLHVEGLVETWDLSFWDGICGLGLCWVTCHDQLCVFRFVG